MCFDFQTYKDKYCMSKVLRIGKFIETESYKRLEERGAGK
jgi:hypothetical protein